MRRTLIVLTTLLMASSLIVMGASNRTTSKAPVDHPAETRVENSQAAPNTPARRSGEAASANLINAPVVSSSAASAYTLDWYSVNGGGATAVSSASYKMGMSAGQSAAGFASGTAYQLGVGFWYGASGGGGACLIAMTGDVNLSMSLTSADIIYLVNFVFKGQAAPLPCEASGDVNCSGSVTSADIIFLVNHVFKGQGPPCDVCTLIPGMWSCP